jgi:hypothetical protein
MSSETSTAAVTPTESVASWKGGVVAGLAGSLVMGALIAVMNPPTIEVAMASLYTLAPPPNGAAGFTVHMAHGAVFGVVFAAILAAPAVRENVSGLLPTVGLGVAYGVVIWVVAAALLMPLWLRAVGSPAQPPFPNFAVPSLLWHVVFGAVLGAVFPFVDEL